MGIIKPFNWLFQIGAAMGDQTRLWVRTDLQAQEMAEVDLFSFVVTPDALAIAPKYNTDWLLDDIAQVPLVLRVNDKNLPYGFASLVEAGPFVTVFRLTVSVQGIHSVLYATLGVGQDVLDLQGFVAVSNPKSPAFTYALTIDVLHGEGAGYKNYLASSLTQWVTNKRAPMRIQTDALETPEGFAIPFYGALVAEPDNGTPLDDFRLQRARAALTGPVVALAGANIWDGYIGPHGAHLPLQVRRTMPKSTGFVDTHRLLMARRPWANAVSSGETGDQGCFGRVKALHMFCDADPMEILALRYSSTDYFLRAHHMLDEAGNPLPWTLMDAQRKTYETQPFYRICASAWKPVNDGYPPYNYDGGRGPLDPQHRGNLYMPAAAVLVGDFILADELDFLLAVECRDVRHGGQGGNTLEAPRAAGRLLQEWAWWWCAANETQRRNLEWLADRMFGILKNQITWGVAGPVKVHQTLSKYDGKNPLRNTIEPAMGFDAWMPWQESFVVDGLIAWANLWRRMGDITKMQEYMNHAIQMASIIVDHGIIEDAALGFVPVTYARWNLNGVANDSNYLTIPRDKAKTTLEGDADMIYGGISMSWYSGAIITASLSNNAKAKRLRNDLYNTARNQTDWEWLVGDPS